jgi:hypothetical protein
MRTGILSASLVSGLGLLAGVMLVSSANPAQAVVYCKYIGYPKGCVARPGVVLAPAPVVRTVTPGVGTPGVGAAAWGTPANRGGPVDRVGRR